MTRVEDLRATAYTIPTRPARMDGTLEWDSTTIVIVKAEGGGNHGSAIPTAIAR